MVTQCYRCVYISIYVYREKTLKTTALPPLSCDSSCASDQFFKMNVVKLSKK